MVKLNREKVAQALMPAGFAPQRDHAQLFLVRRSAVPGLFERVLLLYANPTSSDPGQHLGVNMSIAVVRDIRLMFKGLERTGALRELCTDPDQGHVALRTPEQIDAWLERLAAVAPGAVRGLVEARGEELLRDTQRERVRALEVFEKIVEPTLRSSGLEALVGKLDPRQRALHENLMPRPYIEPYIGIAAQAAAAVAAFILDGDEEVLAFAELDVPRPRTPVESIGYLNVTPTPVAQKIRLLIDRIRADQPLS